MGEREGKKYEEVRHYATLVFDVPPSPGAASTAPGGTAGGSMARQFATLPEATSSFGAVVSDGWLYVYGGHIAPTHSYSTAAVSGQFHRLRLSGKPEWEKLPGGPAMQGMNLAALDGKVYRIGGMTPRGTALRLTTIRSGLCKVRPGHEKVGDSTFSAGAAVLARRRRDRQQGHCHGRLGDSRRSHVTLAILDLSAKNPAWTTAAQPFKRRALMAAAFEGKMYVIGGFDEKNQIVRGIGLRPCDRRVEPGSAATGGSWAGLRPRRGRAQWRPLRKRSDGTLYRLNKSTMEWERAGKSTPRLAHRIASAGDTVLVIGGADKGKNSDLVEAVPVGHGQK